MAFATTLLPEAFFRDLLLKFLKRHPISVTPHTEVYIVGLLSGHVRSRTTDEALCVLLLQQSGDRTMKLKEVGDTALFVTGFFPEAFDSPDYYIALGSSAYAELSNRFRRSALHEVYSELAAQFPEMVGLLQDMSHDLTLGS